MVPKPTVELSHFLDDPVREAAIHFGAFLQRKGLLLGGNQNYGLIEQQSLIDQFTNHYQPQFHSYLVKNELLRTLQKFRVIARSRDKERNSLVRIVKHPTPEGVKPPNHKPRAYVYVDQQRVLRDKLVRSDGTNETKCCLCDFSYTDIRSKQDHENSDLHKYRLLYRQKRSSFPNKVGENCIKLEGLDNDKDVIVRIGERRTMTVGVTLKEPYTTADIYKLINLPEVEAKPTEFRNDVKIKINVSAMFNDPGAYIYPLVAKIMPQRLCLLKDLIFRVESELIDELAPVSAYVQKADVVRQMVGSILPGEELPKKESNFQTKVPLGEHKVPVVYNKLLLHKLQRFENISSYEESFLGNIMGLLCGLASYSEAKTEISKTKSPYIEPLHEDNYSLRFSLLIDFEELQQQSQIKNYDRSNVALRQSNSKFLLSVPDLSEGRPSVHKGDKVHIRLQGQDDVIYEGIVHEVHEHELLLGFHKQFGAEFAKLKKGGKVVKVDVCFIVNRFPLLNMHRALALMQKHKGHSIVFPENKKRWLPTPKTSPRIWQNPLITNNPKQQQAVNHILSRSSVDAPYLVFGPPGTGKTVTLVETIVQVWREKNPIASKQLVCAPSNEACNNVAKRLVNFLPNAKILRLYSLSTEVAHVPNDLLKHCNYDKGSKCMTMPSIKEILAYDIIVSTIVSSGRLVTGGAEGQFQFVYIDECGQASEPESLIAIAGILTSKSCTSMGQLVLAGDPQQLGPILSSSLAQDFGLGMSLLERLMKTNELYMRHPETGYDSKYLTKLVQNFRSHPAILRIPNELFYDNELEPKGDPEIINKALGWKELPNKEFPLIFHGIQGIDERESNSPSYFNRQEIQRVIMYIEKLFENGLPKYKVKATDIGIIAPYRKQVQKFRKAFELLHKKNRSNHWNNIKVGSVEEFQGSEKLIIFISTVRSNVALVEDDYRFKLGFLKNPKRFNVSVTRAQALLIVVGNPNILRHDKQWYQLLTYCRNNNAAVGIPFSRHDPPHHQSEHVPG